MAKIPVNHCFLLPRLSKTDEPVQKWHWIEMGTIAVCCVLLAGCSISIWNTKGASDTKKASQPQNDLVKPKIAIASKGGPSIKVQPTSGKKADEDADSKSPKSQKDRGSPLPREGKGTEANKGRPSGGQGDASTDTDESFKKHDHSEYTRRLKNAAIDTLNKHRGATAARICSDTTTDLWTLTIYSEKRGQLSFVIYFWDEVDGKWEQSFDSGNIPLKKWKNHLRYSSAGKTCKTLKGAHLLGKENQR